MTYWGPDRKQVVQSSWVIDETVIKGLLIKVGAVSENRQGIVQHPEASNHWPNPTGSQRSRETYIVHTGQLPGAQSKGEKCGGKVCRNKWKISAQAMLY